MVLQRIGGPAIAPPFAGVLSALMAFTWWGFFPLYLLLAPGVAALEVLAHRVLWSLLFVSVLLTWRSRWAWLVPALRNRHVVTAFAVSALLLTINWLTYIWAIAHGRVLDASLGYFMTPLVNVMLGFGLLGERPRRAQWLAIALAAVSIVWLTSIAGRPPWLGLVLALSFGSYGLMRKVAVLDALEGFSMETLVLMPVSLVIIGVQWGNGANSFPSPDLSTNAWLIGLGPATALPLVLFATAARRLSLTTLGVLQYVSPTIQLLLGVWLYHEPFSGARLAGFALIWFGLFVYTVDGWQTMRRSRKAA